MPGEDVRERRLAEMLRVDHAGEYGAVQIYRGQRAVFDRTTVVMLSSSDDPRDLRTAAKRGAQCYLLKHPSPTTLAEVIATARIHHAGTDFFARG